MLAVITQSIPEFGFKQKVESVYTAELFTDCVVQRM